jgi:hypothetical protein
MIRSPSTDLAGTQAPLVQVRTRVGELVGRIPSARVEELVAAGLVSPIGRNSVKYLVLNGDEPTPARPWRGGSRTTHRERIPMQTGVSFLVQHNAPWRPVSVAGACKLSQADSQS